jgi:hypothetical protein
MYRYTPEQGFASTLAITAEAVQALVKDGWNADPHAFGVEVVPYPCMLLETGLVHTGEGRDANGNSAYGPPPTVPGIASAAVMR